MKREIFGILLVFGLLVLAASPNWAVLKGLENGKQEILKIGGDIDVPAGAEVKGAVALGGSITVGGKVVRDVVAVGGSVNLKDSAEVGGDVVSVGGNISKAAGAVVKGEIRQLPEVGVSPAVGLLTKRGVLKALAFFSLLSFIGFLILVIILVAIFTPQLGQVSAAVEKHALKSFLVGLLLIFLFIPVIVLLAVSIVGIVLIPVWIILAVAAGLFGYIGAAHFVGKKIIHAFRLRGKSMMVETLTGVILLFLVGLVPIGGALVKAIILCWGLGGVTLTRFGTVRA
jgi:hypothetical protein